MTTLGRCVDSRTRYPTSYDPARPDDDPDCIEHWMAAWLMAWRRAVGRAASADGLHAALEAAADERRYIRRARGRLNAGPAAIGYRWMDGSGLLLTDDAWMMVSPDGTARAGHVEWEHPA